MTIFIDTTNGVIVRDKTFTVPLQNLTFKRGDIAAVTIKFLVDREIQTPSASREIRFGVKAAGSYDSDFLVYADTYSIDGDGYLLEVNLNTEALNALFNIDEDSGNDVETVTLMGEIAWSDITDYWNSSNTIPVIVNNDVIRGTEGTPLPSKTVSQWIEEDFESVGLAISVVDTGEEDLVYPRQEPTQGSGTILFDDAIEVGDTLTIGLSTYFYTDILAGENDILITPGNTVDEIAGRTLSAINATDGNNPYNTVPNTQVYAVSGTEFPGQIVIHSRNYGAVNYVLSGDFLQSVPVFSVTHINGIPNVPAPLGRPIFVYGPPTTDLDQITGSGEIQSYWLCVKSVPEIGYYQHRLIVEFIV